MRLEGKGNTSQSNTERSSLPHSNGGGAPQKSTSSGLSNGKADSNGYTNGHESVRPIGPFFGHDREEVTRILIQGLTDLGYDDAASTLSRESGFELENPSVAAFRNAVLDGQWAEAEALLFGSRDGGGGGVRLEADGLSTDRDPWPMSDGAGQTRSTSPPGLPLAEGCNKQEMLFCIRQQKYLELLEERDLGGALMVLRQELTPLRQETNRLHALSSLIMCQSAEALKSQAMWDGATGASRIILLSELSKSIAPSVMIPEHRLAVLLDLVQERQTDDCLYHNTTVPPSLYYNHDCDRQGFPLHRLLDLHHHTDEVWYIEFSHDGTMLATASNDNSIIIYDTETWQMMQRFRDDHVHPTEGVQGVCYVAWSPDDKYLISCSTGKDLIVYNVAGKQKILVIDGFEYPVTCAVWSPDGASFVIGTHDPKRPMGLYHISDTEPLFEWPHEENRLRISDMSISADGSRLAAITLDQRVLVYDFRTKLRIADWAMENKMTCVNLSADGKSILVSMNKNRLLLLDAETGDTKQTYKGLKQAQYVIRSGFGGAAENFVLSGSEDSHVYIWRKQSGIQVAKLEAHFPGSVNSVAWHPTNPMIWASAGDDHKVRIWSTREESHRHPAHLGLVRTL